MQWAGPASPRYTPFPVSEYASQRIDIRAGNALISADPETEQLDRGTASAGCGPGATGKTRVRSLELTGMAVMVVPGSGIGRVM